MLVALIKLSDRVDWCEREGPRSAPPNRLRTEAWICHSFSKLFSFSLFWVCGFDSQPPMRWRHTIFWRRNPLLSLFPAVMTGPHLWWRHDILFGAVIRFSLGKDWETWTPFSGTGAGARLICRRSSCFWFACSAQLSFTSPLGLNPRAISTFIWVRGLTHQRGQVVFPLLLALWWRSNTLLNFVAHSTTRKADGV